MTSADLPNSDPEPRWHGRVAVVVLVVGTLAVMGRLCTNDFTWWDDQGTVHHNPWLLPPTFRTVVHYWTTPENGLYIPLTYMVWAGVALIARVQRDPYGIALNPWLFHGTNVLCHLLAVLVAYRILRLLNADVFASVCGAFLFGLHPIQVEAVAWVSGLKDVLSGLFALIAIWQYVSFSLSDLRGRASIFRYLLATAAFVLAMLAKPSAIALPLAAIAIDRWGVGRPWKRVFAGASGWVLISLPIALIARWAQDAGNTPLPSLWLRPLIACDSLAFYMGKLVWPVNLIIDYGRNPTNVIDHGWCYWDWVFPVTLAAILIFGVRKRPVLLGAGIIFVAGCLPVLGFTGALFQYFSTTTDHYLYFSMFGPALALAWILSVRPTMPLRFGAVLLLTVFSVLTLRQERYWQNDFTLFEHDTEVNRNSYAGFLNLGGAYDRINDLSDATAAFENATRANPDYGMAWSDLAAEWDRAGKADLAIAAVQKSIQIQAAHPNLQPTWIQDNELLGHLLFIKGEFAQAIPYLQAAAIYAPDDKALAVELKDALRHGSTQPATMPATLPAAKSESTQPVPP